MRDSSIHSRSWSGWRGGVLLACVLAFAPAAAFAVDAPFVQTSEPLGLVDASAMLPVGQPVTTVTAPSASYGYGFAYWTLNGVERRDVLGRAVNPVTFVLLEENTAVAHYLPLAEDADANGVPDWWEREFHTQLVTNATSDADSDGFTLAEEYRRDYHPNLANDIRDGGFTVVFSPASRMIVNTNLSVYTRCSDPEGVLTTTEQVLTNGNTVSVGSVYGASGGYSFAFWTLNGERKADVSGRALGGFAFTLASNTTVQARYVPTGQDGDADGLPDWYECNIYGHTNWMAVSDTDGDGFTLAEEYRRDYHPAISNDISDGGFTVVFSPASRVIVNTNLSVYTRCSDPEGVLTTTEQVLTNGNTVSVGSVYGANGSYTFAFWTLNGERHADVSGRALSGFTFTLASNTTAQARYVPTGQDGDADGLPDWYEYNSYGATNNAALSDTDGDGFTLAEEYRRDYHPAVSNDIRDGGFTVVFSPASRMLVNTNLSLYTRCSAPEGVLTTTEQVLTNGNTVSVGDAYGASGGYSFAFWTLNGERQADVTGRALGGFSFTLASNTTAQAYYIPSGQDGDADGLPDWYEYNNYGHTNWTASSDTDGDGFALAEEYRRDYHPAVSNDIRDGGFTLVMSPAVMINLQLFPRIPVVLVNGAYERFFTFDTATTGTFRVSANSHPALGDWDGDGDFDLFVGGSGGTLRMYENAGSPVVPNLVERTANFAALAGLWASVGNVAPALGDCSGDGRDDLAIGGATGTVWLARSGGAGGTNAWGEVGEQSAAIGVPVAGATRTVPAFGDLTGDGRVDLLVLAQDGVVRFYANTGNPEHPYADTPTDADLLGLAAVDAEGLAVADIDQDGDLDVLVSDTVGRIWEFRNSGAGAFGLTSMIFGGTFNGFAHRLTVAAADVDGDGDTDLVCGYAEGGIVYLRNPAAGLEIRPPVATVMTGDTLTLKAFNAAGPTAWSLRRNNSGGTIVSNTGAYVAGLAGGVIDCVEGVSGGLRGRAYVNVIGPADVARAGKAVVISGRRSADDPVWPVSDYLADLGYNTLRYRGFSKENIQYLSPIPGRDKDGNGLLDDIDLASTYANAATTITNWACNASRLFVYLVDHGSDVDGNASFALSPTEALPARNLDAWLDALQDRYHMEVTVLIECCYAGSFLDELTYDGTAKRVVIASCSDAQLTYFASGGLVSFSDAFFSGVLLGLDVWQAFELAREAMATFQSAWLDDNNDGVYDGSDGQVASGIWIGSSFLAGKDIPQIGRVQSNQLLNGDTVATLEAGDVASQYPLARVWCIIVPPGHEPTPGNPVASLPEIDLTYDSAYNSYRGDYGGFAQEGTYKVIYYAKDIWGSVSLPRESWVTQTGYDERVVLATGVSRGEPAGGEVRHVMELAYQTLLARRIGEAHIRVLSPEAGIDLNKDGTGDVDGPATRAGLSAAITNWAAGASKLTVFLVGKSQDCNFLLESGEQAAGAELDQWLDVYQASNGQAIVVLDFNGAGGYLEPLRATGQQDRIIVASTKKGGSSEMSNGGLVSFAQHFLNGVFDGFNVWTAFVQARDAIKRQSGKKSQEAQLDDNGDGVYGKTDGKVAVTRYIGTAFATGADAPAVGQIMPDAAAVGTNTLTLWAAEVTSMAGISNVWCLITSPDYDGTGDLPQVNLTWNPAAWRYEAAYDGFTQPGTYTLTFQAADVRGKVSAPVLCDVLTPDAFEPDDSSPQASLYLGPPQAHNLHGGADVDWVRVYLVPDFAYDIDAVQVSAGLDIVMDLYRALPDGTPELIERVDLGGAGVSEHTFLDFPESGFYYVRLSRFTEEGLTGDGLGTYTFSVSIPSAGTTGTLIVLGIDDIAAGALPAGATATVSGQGAKAFNGSASVSFTGLTNGTYLVTVPAPANFIPREDPDAPGQVQSLTNAYYANPRRVTVSGGWQMAGFELLPCVTVADGVVRDAWTRAYVPGAQLTFTARSGALSGTAVDGGVMLTSYRNPWLTQANGACPTGMVLGACDWDLSVSAAGYVAYTRANAISNAPRGSVLSLGTAYLTPVDANGNAVGDAWEARYFPAGMSDGDADADGDGLNNRQESLVGTDPTDARSVLRVQEAKSAGVFTLAWPAAEGRRYRVCATNVLAAPEPWPPVAGPWEAAPGQTGMQWTDTGAAAVTNRFYRVQLLLP